MSVLAAREAAFMARRHNKGRRTLAKTVLRLPDLEQSKNAVLNSLAAPSSQEWYRHAMEEFIGWDCSNLDCISVEPLCFGIGSSWSRRTLRLQQLTFAWPQSRRLAYEASDTGL